MSKLNLIYKIYGSSHVLFYPVASIDDGLDGKDTIYFALDTKKGCYFHMVSIM